MSIAYVIGFICGLVFVFICCLFIRKVFFKTKAVYDERQQMEQGKACKYGFYFLLFYTLMIGVFSSFLEKLDIELLSLIIGGTFISVLIYAGYCIWKEAYFPINQKSIKWVILLIVIGVFNVFIAIVNRGINMNSTIINIMAAILVFSISILSLIKLKMGSVEPEDSEDAEAAEEET